MLYGTLIHTYVRTYVGIPVYIRTVCVFCLYFIPRSDTMNEMCNFYIMYYMANDNQDLDVDMCGIGTWDTPIHPPPLDTVTTQSPTTPTTTPPTTPPRNEVDHGGDTVPMLQMSADWMLSGLEGEETSPILSVGLGQVSAVEVDHNGNVLILHRGSRGWDYRCVSVYNHTLVC